MRRVATLGTKFDWSPETAAQAAAGIDPEKWLAKAPFFIEMLKTRHGEDGWLRVVEKTKAMMHGLGAAPDLTAERLAEISTPVLVMLGELDNTVPEEVSRAAAEQLKAGRFLLLPGVKHAFEQVDTASLANVLSPFFTEK